MLELFLITMNDDFTALVWGENEETAFACLMQERIDIPLPIESISYRKISVPRSFSFGVDADKSLSVEYTINYFKEDMASPVESASEGGKRVFPK